MDGQAKPWPEILVIGDALMDTQYWVERIPAPGEDAVITARQVNTGGSAANSAMGLAWLGASCGLVACIGEDEPGGVIMDLLFKVGVDTRLIQYDGHTGYVLSMIDPTGERTMFSYRGAAETTTLTPRLEEAITSAKVVLLSGYMLSNKKQAPLALEIAEKARDAGVHVALDASPKFGSLTQEMRDAALNLCDIFLPNRDELTASGPGNWEDNLLVVGQQVPCVAVKLGGAGALLRLAPGFVPSQPEAFRLVSSTKVQKPVDTTGAGDAFNAGFLAAFVQGRSPAQWLETGNKLAGKVIATRGATGLYKTTPPPKRD